MFTIRDVIAELTYPFRDAAILLAMPLFALLFTLSVYAGPFGLWLVLALMPAFFHYLLVVLEARAKGEDAPAVGIELFSWVQHLWKLLPLVLSGMSGWGVYLLAAGGYEFLAGMLAALLFALFPVSLAILAVTHSPFESLRPSRLWLMVRSWGRYYLLVLAVTLVGAVLFYLASSAGLPLFIKAFSAIYALSMLATVSGSAIALQDVQVEVSIPDSVLPDAKTLAETANRNRNVILNHAYGLVSRGNRSGGVRHVLEAIKESADQAADYRWFFTEMLRWDDNYAALLVGQQFISLLLADGEEQEACKMIARCRYMDAAFRLLDVDKKVVMRIAERRGDTELLEWLST